MYLHYQRKSFQGQRGGHSIMVRYWTIHFKDEVVDHATFNGLTTNFESEGMDHMSLNYLAGRDWSSGRLHFSLKAKNTWEHYLHSFFVCLSLFWWIIRLSQVSTSITVASKYWQRTGNCCCRLSKYCSLYLQISQMTVEYHWCLPFPPPKWGQLGAHPQDMCTEALGAFSGGALDAIGAGISSA